MSAYLCNKHHIATLAATIATKVHGAPTAPEVAKWLTLTNIKSVNHRYADSAEMTIDAETSATIVASVVRETESATPPALTPLRLVGMARCSEYQSCEHPGWEKSKAKRWLAKLTTWGLTGHTYPNSEEMGWEYCPVDIAPPLNGDAGSDETPAAPQPDLDAALLAASRMGIAPPTTRARSLTKFNDPGHGWLRVPRSDLAELGIAAQITSFSYQNGDWAYLEEDCDASTFRDAAEAAGWSLHISERTANGESSIRSYACYTV